MVLVSLAGCAAPGVPVDAGSAGGRVEAWPAVLLNEALPGNDSIATDEALDFDDWVELYNASDGEVDLGGWGLADDLGAPDWTFPAGTTIGPGAHLVVWADDEPGEGELHATFALATERDELALFAPDGAVVDDLAWTATGDDVVVGRFPSGGVFRSASVVATPGNANPVDPGVSRDPSDALFPEDRVVRLDLSLDPEGVAALEADSYATVRAGLGFEGAWFDDIELHIKGQWGSHREFDQKAAFKLDLDGLVPGRRLRGLEHLTLNNLVQDASGVHELLGYRLLRDAGVPAPRVAHAELWLNGEYRGLYLNVETPDDAWLERWFADPHGNLYEGEYGQDVTLADLADLELDEQGAADVTDRSDLEALATFLAQEPSEAVMPEFEARFDLDRTLGMLAGEVLLGHWDGYFYSANNWRIYHDPSADRWTILAWGIDQTFDWSADVHAPVGDISEFCLAVPSCRIRYDLALWDMAERMLTLDCAERVDGALDRIVPLFEADPLREGSVDEMLDAAAETVEFCESYPAEVLAQLFPDGVP